jgi:hypothetical protein
VKGTGASVGAFAIGVQTMANDGNWVRIDLKGLHGKGQPLSSVCWQTCYEMLYEWKGIDSATIEAKLTAAGIDYEAARKGGLMPEDFTKAARALGLSAVSFGQSISAWDLKQPLHSSPLWMVGEWFKSSLHARLVIGASDDYVEYFDPFWGGSYGMDFTSSHKDPLDIFVHGNGTDTRGTDKLIGTTQMSYWKVSGAVQGGAAGGGV